jgi:hypothetical protein
MHEDISRQALWRYNHFHRWQDFKTCFCLLNREAELKRLIAWAQCKRLTNPRRLYERRLNETQTQLWRLQLRSPKQWRWAKVGQGIGTFLFPPPKYPVKGSAATYKTVKRIG